ncbi:MAG: stage V sporulation protein AD [Clostridia bacterium]|nr:stage V sporulation protein AD [Clostridia bacterium]
MARETVYFDKQPKITAVSTIAGQKEKSGPISEFIDEFMDDDRFNEDTFEKAECKMLSHIIGKVVEKKNLPLGEVDALIAGDLLNQIISSSFAARNYSFPYIGVYSACSTMSESMIIGSLLLNGGHMENVICATGSHFSTAERQYRYPLELGSTRPPQSQWTVTGAGACLLSNNEEDIDYPKIVSATFGKVIDYGVTDANNMGAAMAPACADTIVTHLKNTKTKPTDYNLIVTGDLGVLGSRIVKDLVWEKGYDMNSNHVDCGEMIYNICEEEFQGGSGAGCSAVVFNSFFYKKLLQKRYDRILFLATGALLSSVSSQQGESIPCISHAVEIKR